MEMENFWLELNFSRKSTERQQLTHHCCQPNHGIVPLAIRIGLFYGLSSCLIDATVSIVGKADKQSWNELRKHDVGFASINRCCKDVGVINQQETTTHVLTMSIRQFEGSIRQFLECLVSKSIAFRHTALHHQPLHLKHF